MKFTNAAKRSTVVRKRFLSLAIAPASAVFLSIGTATADPVLMPVLQLTGGQPSVTTSELSTGGWSFNLTGPLDIYGLGLWDEGGDGLLAPHSVALWESNGALLSSVTVGNSGLRVSSHSPAGDWLFTTFAAPLLLAPGEYVVGAAFESAIEDQLRVNASVVTLAGVTFTGAGFHVADFAFPHTLFPQSVGNAHYFGPNLLALSEGPYSDPAPPIPEPGTIGLVTTGAVGLFLKNRRAKRRR
jgi:hypothetical protein